MSLSVGACLGPYEILAAIGAGGMGEVYKARDTRLDRTVAIKILPSDISGDPGRRARFEREAKTIAGLNHSHICTLYDVGDHDGAMFLVMEHLAGQTLAQRLEKGPLPFEQALTVATEIADALAAAHRQGVIHRDLKPGNVMLTKTGAKLLDFGLAKLAGHGEQPAAASLASAPTRTAPLTSEGAIVGTLQYMAPEQVEGRPADARSDLWALGAILYEMLTGTRAFQGVSAASLIANIMNAEPPAIVTLQPITPPGLDRLVRKCLAKDPDARWASARDVADELRWIPEAGGVGVQAGVRRAPGGRLRAALIVAGAFVMAAIGGGLTWLFAPAPPRAPLTRVTLDVRPAEDLNAGGFRPILTPVPVRTPGGALTALAWTPDGRALIFVGRRDGVQQLYVRRLDAVEATPLPNTEGAQLPAVSADGQWVAFWVGGAIKKVRVEGGPSVDVASEIPNPPCGLAWDDGGRLFLGSTWSGRGISVVQVGGALQEVTKLGETELAHQLPRPLPGGRALLYTVRKRNFSWGDEQVVVQTLATGARKVLLKDATDARYVPTGHLLFLRRGVLLAAPFDLERLEVDGTPVPVLDRVAQALTGATTYHVTGAGQFAVSATGSLAWISSPVLPYPDGTLVTVDRQGRVVPLSPKVRSYHNTLRVSPDGGRLAVAIRDLAGVGLWEYNLSRGTLNLLTGRGEATFPAWSSDGQRLAFRWLTEGRMTLGSQRADGATPAEVFAAGSLFPASIATDGRQVLAVLSSHIVMVRTESGKVSVQPIVQTARSDGWPAVSPDGRWLAYASDVSGRSEVYVRPAEGPGPAESISLDGAASPAWNPNGRELFFVASPDPAGIERMLAVEFAPGSPPRIGRPRVLFDFDNRDLALASMPTRSYDVAPDGQHFYAVRYGMPSPPTPVTHISLMLNWFEELKAKVPVKR